jgi:regulator of replication initiation timing
VDKKDIFLQLENMEEQMGVTYADLGALKKRIIQLLEENNRLSLENQQLRKLLKREDVPVPAAETDRQALTISGDGYDNLANLYHEGFHICNVYYGHLRTEGDCLFCMSFLNK